LINIPFSHKSPASFKSVKNALTRQYSRAIKTLCTALLSVFVDNTTRCEVLANR